ncbi:MAG: hypothetical protein KAT32_03620 [Candidatus Moranbacteria bacterium]|nr:hypothetical protein [Candidatus Moranbacteria bacterium]
MNFENIPPSMPLENYKNIPSVPPAVLEDKKLHDFNPELLGGVNESEELFPEEVTRELQEHGGALMEMAKNFGKPVAKVLVMLSFLAATGVATPKYAHGGEMPSQGEEGITFRMDEVSREIEKAFNTLIFKILSNDYDSDVFSISAGQNSESWARLAKKINTDKFFSDNEIPFSAIIEDYRRILQLKNKIFKNDDALLKELEATFDRFKAVAKDPEKKLPMKELMHIVKDQVVSQFYEDVYKKLRDHNGENKKEILKIIRDGETKLKQAVFAGSSTDGLDDRINNILEGVAKELEELGLSVEFTEMPAIEKIEGSGKVTRRD